MLASAEIGRRYESPVRATRDDWTASLRPGSPSSQGLNPEALRRLTRWVESSGRRVFSLLISRHGRLAYELYTSNLTREHSHYVMSVTKSFTSALMGIAMQQGAVPGPDTHVSEALPARLFQTERHRDRFESVTLKHVMGMSALGVADPPRDTSPESRARQRSWWNAHNRTVAALAQPLLPEPGRSFLYTDFTPSLASGALTYGTQESAFDFAQRNLFAPLGFRNAEWMHQDPSGIDNGGYGLRVRPIDMQKFGNLYLRGGDWNGRQIIPREWVDASFRPWIASDRSNGALDYGWHWWKTRFAGETAHYASGWKGQRIIVVPERELVVTTTGIIERDERDVVRHLMEDHILPSIDDSVDLSPNADKRVAEDNERVRRTAMRVTSDVQPRMVPSVERKERHRPFQR
jgi:CubicO group peptidase (beta-lactamase class C family)